MTGEENLTRHIRHGEAIAPWLALGPFYQDLSAQISGLTLFEQATTTVGVAEIDEIVADVRAAISVAPREGQAQTFRGQDARWSLVRRPETFLSWGEYFISNHLGAILLATTITSKEAGSRCWRLTTRISCRALVAINRALVFDTGNQPPLAPGTDRVHSFEAPLQEGDNIVTVAVLRVGRMAQVGCRIEVDRDVTAGVHEAMSHQQRAGIEEEIRSLALPRDLLQSADEVALDVGRRAASDGTRLRLRLETPTGEVLRETAVDRTGRARLGTASELPDGDYALRCTWEAGDGRGLTSVSYDLRKVTPERAVPGVEHIEQRARRVLKRFASAEVTTGQPAAKIWTEVARYALGQYADVDEDTLTMVCEFIAARKDCADFHIQGVLRLMYWERDDPKLSPQINALLKDTVLGFKYWIDEPGDTVMYMGSENHRLLFHVAEWMAGQIFPTEEFVNSRQRGLYHAAKGRMYITEWLRQRGRFGFNEWHSNSYFPVCVAPLANVYDFTISEDQTLRQLAGSVLDYMAFILAADTLGGVFGTTHGRSYTRYLKHPDFEGTAAICWLLYGTGSLTTGAGGMAPVALATSSYRPPAILAKLATDDSAVVESKQRHGVHSGGRPSANFCVYRTPDYLISGLQDHRKGEYEPSSHVGQVTFANRAVIFWSCPQTSAEGGGLRPDYWSGHTTLPRVVQHRNVMSLTWRLTEHAWMTHCFFEQERFDDVRFAGNWVLARAGRGYAGIYSENGLRLGVGGQYAGRELICDAAENTWLVECGREADWGSFDRFCQALSAADIASDDGTVSFESPSIGRFVTGWDASPTVGGTPIQLRDYPLVESPWVSSAFGSGELAIRYGDETYDLWFNQ